MKELIKKILPSFLISFYHFCLAFLGAFLYCFPSKKMKVIGITGTKGKSTVVILAGKILEEAGFKIGWISSATLKIDQKEWLNPYHLTMPGRFFLQKMMKRALKRGCKYFLIEVTSEGILQHRHRFIDFDAAVFTNLSPEHIERHGSFENYRAAKGELFKATKEIHIINLDNENSEYYLKFPAKEKWGYEINSKFKTQNSKPQLKIVKAENCQILNDGLRFFIENIEFRLKLYGKFNIYNALAAICIALSQGINLETCKKALEKIETIPGRMEMIINYPFKVIVDFAHTPDSFNQIFKLVKNWPHKRIISIFGSAGGGRDKWKRPEMGKIASQYCDKIILTTEDPYEEDSLKIIKEIEKGIEESGFRMENCIKIEDRKEAIKKGLKLAQRDDIVLILGKGTEQSLIIGNQKIPWDERRIVHEEFKKLNP